jgi:type IV secretory pathway VirB3-like protein
VAVLAFVAEAVRIVAVRTLVSDETETVRDEFVSRNLLSATLNGFVGGVVVLILVAVGLVFLVVPGVYLAIAFFFVRQEIAVEDRNFVEALSASWERTSGHRLRLFGLALVVFLVGVVVTAVGGVVGFVGVPLLTTLVTVLLGAVTVVFGVAVTCRAYVQLSDADDAERDVDVDTDEESEWKYNP